ncbi:MAG: YncE family protein [Planctomycetota bacterium]|nr:MAG: YncE family protein [Planctomycetota bacterium]
MLSRLTPLIVALAALPAPGQTISTSDLPFDRMRSRWMNYETSPTALIAFGPTGNEVWVISQPGMRLSARSATDLAVRVEIPVGPGLVAVVWNPQGTELWCVDSVTSSVSVIDAATERIIRTIRVGAQPGDIEFDADGSHAYVACAGVDRVDVVLTDSYEVVASIPIPARMPHALARIGEVVYVVPMRSGNGTAPLGNAATGATDDIVEVRHVAEFEGATPLPDGDLFAISTISHQLIASDTRSGLGTTLYNVHARPWTDEVWIPATDALNGVHRGETNYVAGQVVRNFVTVVDTASGTHSIIDLDALSPAPELNCGTPTAIAFTSNGNRAFVVGYGSDTIAVLDIEGTDVTWAGTIRIHQAFVYADGAGPRDCRVGRNDEELVVVCKGDGSITRIVLADLPPGPDFVFDAPQAQLLGWDPTPVDINQGRIHFIRTQNSLSKTSSCNSCHVDGGTDGLAWDLSKYLEPEGTPDDELAMGLDVKGPLVTQSLRRPKEVGPYHWRGEKKALAAFDGTFPDLLERESEGVTQGLAGDFFYLTQYLEHLALLPNPNQSLDREYTPAQLAGAELFLNEPVFDGLSCNDCHTLPLGTNGEIIDTLGGGLAPFCVVPQLRTVATKLVPPFAIGGLFGTRTELGAGLLHGGSMPTLQAVIRRTDPEQIGHRFDLTEGQADALAAFLEALDTGVAPAAAYQATAHPGNTLDFGHGELAFLVAEADKGNCDVVYRYGPEDFLGEQRYFSGVYDPTTGKFQQASFQLPQLTTTDLMQKAASGMPVTFFGVPVFMGHPMGIDRDNDKLLDLDEIARGTNPENNDTDGDGFPDGYEVEWVQDPLTPQSGMPDSVPPTMLAAPMLVYATNHAIKFEFATDEQARALISYDGGIPVLRAPLKPKFDDVFSVVISDLEAATTYHFEMSLDDPAGNSRIVTFDFETTGANFPTPVRVENIHLQLVGTAPQKVHASVLVMRGGDMPVMGYSLNASLYYVTPSGVEFLARGQTWIGSPTGTAHFFIPIPSGLQPGGELVFVMGGIDEPPGEVPYVGPDSTVLHAVLPY